MMIHEYILHFVGKPYKDQATGPESFSCSGLISAGLRAFGLIDKTKHMTEEEMFRTFFHFSIPINSGIRPGDILLFGDLSDTTNKNPLTHCGMAINSWQMVESSNGSPEPGVRVRPIKSRPDLAAVIRIPYTD